MTRAFAVEVWSRAFVADENKDAFATRVSADGSQLRAAVADGTSATLFSRQWADLLVLLATDGPPRSTDLAERVDDARAGFDPLVGRLDVHRKVAEKWLLHGSASTLVSVTGRLTPRGDVHVDAVAAGDSVLIVLDGCTVQVFPPLGPGDFGRSPAVIESSPGLPVPLASLAIDAPAEAVFALATDGAAHPLLRLVERDGADATWRCFAELCADTSTDALERVLTSFRLGALDDDATLVLFAATRPARSAREALSAHLSSPAPAGSDDTDRGSVAKGRWRRLVAFARRLVGHTRV